MREKGAALARLLREGRESGDGEQLEAAREAAVRGAGGQARESGDA